MGTSPSRSGVFSTNLDVRVADFTESISFDRRLFRHDLAGSRAHATMLADVGLLERSELAAILAALAEIELEIDEGRFRTSPALEDIHMHIEQALIERLGDVGRKLHTGRSRNDQVATDLRLWCRESIDQLDELLKLLQRAFLARCDRDRDVILPAYTHLQRAQPVLAAQYWLAYCERFQRDRDRLQDCRQRANVCVLGAAAVAGTSLPIDRQNVARRLGMLPVAANSVDASCDRDFLLEFVFCLATVAIHLSGWAEEWILWSTVEFGYLRLPDAFCTGSSIMPQKINPDVLELIRGRTARAVAALQGLMTLTKGLPLAYHRDLQEDKLHAFAAYDSVRDCLELAGRLVHESQLQRDVIASRVDKGYLDATTLMESLIERGMPQRTAHHRVGQIVRRAMELGCSLSELPLSEYQSCDSQIDAWVYEVVGVRNAVERFRSEGSTAPSEVEQQLEQWKVRLADV